MSSNPHNKAWICEGAPPKYPKHPPLENPQGLENCLQCGRPYDYQPGSSNSSGGGLPLRMVGVGLVSLILILLAGFSANRLARACPEGQERKFLINCREIAETENDSQNTQNNPSPQGTQTAQDPQNPQTAQATQGSQTTQTAQAAQGSQAPINRPQIPMALSSGEKLLFTGSTNPAAELGAEAFKRGNFKEAENHFKQAVTSDRRSPEFQIYLNNSKAELVGSPVVIGVVVPIGTAANSAAEILRGVADAQERFNQTRGLNEPRLKVIIANDNNDENDARNAAIALINDQDILGVVGHNASSASKSALKQYKRAGLAMISPTSTSTELRDDVFFRTLSSDEDSGKTLAEYARNQRNFDSVATFFNPKSTYSSSINNAFKNAFKNLGGKVIENDISDPGFDPETKVRNLGDRAKAIVLFPDTAYVSVANGIAVANKNTLPLLGGDSLYNPDTLTLGSGEILGLVLVVPWFAESDYAKNSEERWLGRVSWRTAMSFDATQALIKALSPPGTSRDSVLKTLKNMTLDASQTSDGEELQFDTNGERQTDPILVEAVRSNKFTPDAAEFTFKPLQQ